jgi:hypothetical protein
VGRRHGDCRAGSYPGETAGKKPLLKPIALVNRYELLDFALNDEELLTHIEGTLRAAGDPDTAWSNGRSSEAAANPDLKEIMIVPGRQGEDKKGVSW